MDFDLFENEDDDILSSINISPTQQTDVTNYTIPEFNCMGEDHMSSQFSTDSFVKNFFVQNENSKNPTVKEITLTAYEFKRKCLDSTAVLEFVFGTTRMNMQNIVASLKDPIETSDCLTYYQRRRQVTLFYHLLLSEMNDILWLKAEKHLFSLRKLLNRVTNPETLKLIYIANSSKGNETNTPAYHFLHGFLEWKFLDLYILQKYEKSELDVTEDKSVTQFSLQLERIFDDLIILSVYLFLKKNSLELISASPFPCTCCKELWLLMQLFLEKFSTCSGVEYCFWDYFNRSIDRLKNNLDFYSINLQRLFEFINWMTKGLTRLQGYRSNGVFEGPHHARVKENYEYLETIIRNFFDTNPSEEQIRSFICVLMPVILEWWRPNVNIPMLLWEYFHKRLNSSFFIARSTPDCLAVSSTSGKGYLEKCRSILEACQTDANASSFTLFTVILGTTLERLTNSNQKSQTQKVLGRIYSKFSLSKFFAFNETGLHNLIELFLVIALTGGDFTDVAPKLKEKLLSISLDKLTANKRVTIMKGHVAFLILFSEKSCDMTEYLEKLLQQLNSIKNDLKISKILADGLLDILRNSDDFSCGEHLLIDSWIPNFLSNCLSVEQERVLEALHLIFEKIYNNNMHLNSNNNEILLKNLTLHILPFVKLNYAESYSLWTPRLAADFCIYTTFNDISNFQRIFRFFIEANSVNILSLPKFLVHIMESDKSSLVDNSTIIQVWLKCLVLLSGNNEDVLKLTKITVDLDEFQFVTNIVPNDEILTAKEPLCVFVAAVGKAFDSCTNFEKRCRISDLFNSYLTSFQKWISSDIKNEKVDVTFRFYSFIAIVVYNCANIVYTKSKNTCFFHVALTRFILPTTVQIGKTPELKLIQVIHKIWPVLIQGMGRLNFRSDPYITKTMTDLIVKWTPHFKLVSPNSKVVAKPFLTCIKGDNDALSLFVFEKLTSMFLATQRRQADSNACLVITIFQEIVESIISDGNSNEKQLTVFLKATNIAILEHVMMVDEIVPSRTLLLEMFKKILHSRLFQSSTDLRSLLVEHLRIITKRHLSYYTFFYFDLLTKIAKIYYPLIVEVMTYLEEEIKVVEAKRGSGEDNRIRTCLHKLKGEIATLTK